MKSRLWWWALLLAAFVLVGQFTSAGTAWRVVQYAGLSVIGLVFVLLLVAGFVEHRSNRGKRDAE